VQCAVFLENEYILPTSDILGLCHKKRVYNWNVLLLAMERIRR